MISVIIPTLDGAHYLPPLVSVLRNQSLKDIEIVIVDSESSDGTTAVARSLGCAVHRVSRNRFDHGGARNFAAGKSSGEILVFLTQDALPTSRDFLALLTAPLDGHLTAASYARQIPASDAPPTEAFARLHNYPVESSLRHISRVQRRTLKTFFFSNTASAIDRACFERVGRFPAPVLTNEDMLFCARLLDGGYQVAYAAQAQVIHSHNFSFTDLFRRYFRIGAVTREHRDVLRCASNSKDGIEFVRKQIAYLHETRRNTLIPRALIEASIKALAFQCGRLPRVAPRVPTHREQVEELG